MLIRYTDHMSPAGELPGKRLKAALKRAKDQHPRWTAVDCRFAGDRFDGPILVDVEVEQEPETAYGTMSPFTAGHWPASSPARCWGRRNPQRRPAMR